MNICYSNEEIIYQILKIEDSRLGPEARLLLLRIFWRFGLQHDIKDEVKNLAKEFDLSEGVYSKARETLLKLGYVEHLTPPKGGRGRPLKGFSISKSFIENIEEKLKPIKNEFLKIKMFNLPLIKYVLRNTLQFQNEFEDRIRPATKILMLALLAGADEVGVVGEWSYGRFVALTGMKKDRLKGQIDRLKRVGFIRRCIPGGTGKGLYGVVRGGCLINLGWKGAIERKEPVERHFFKSGLRDIEARDTTAQCSLLDLDREDNVISELLNESVAMRLDKVTTWNILQYTAYLLEFEWYKLGVDGVRIDTRRLCGRIESELFLRARSQIVKTVGARKPSLEVVCIFSISEYLAVGIKSRLSGSKLVSRSGLKYLFIPSASRLDEVCLEIYAGGSDVPLNVQPLEQVDIDDYCL